MEGSIARAYKSVEQCQADYNHVLHQFSNNRFIARAYTRFCHEILADHAAASEWFEKTRILQMGIMASVDHASELGLTCFPLFPATLSSLTNGLSATFVTETEVPPTQEPFDMDEDTNAQLIEQLQHCLKTLNV